MRAIRERRKNTKYFKNSSENLQPSFGVHFTNLLPSSSPYKMRILSDSNEIYDNGDLTLSSFNINEDETAKAKRMSENNRQKSFPEKQTNR